MIMYLTVVLKSVRAPLSSPKKTPQKTSFTKTYHAYIKITLAYSLNKRLWLNASKYNQNSDIRFESPILYNCCAVMRFNIITPVRTNNK